MIYLGSKDLAERARALVQVWRTQAETPDDRRKRDLLRIADDTAMCGAYSGRGRRRLRAEARRVADDPANSYCFTLHARWPYSTFRGGKRGRPSRSGLI
jgi:hypothetical protein